LAAGNLGWPGRAKSLGFKPALSLFWQLAGGLLKNKKVADFTSTSEFGVYLEISKWQFMRPSLPTDDN
jgi:hypothetical protein